MKSVRNILAIIFLIQFFTLSITKGSEEAGTRFFSKLNLEIHSLMEKYKIPGVIIAVIENGEVAFLNAYGFANIETGRRMSINDVCRVESISKSVTTWGIMKLVEQGKLNIDTPVVEYLKSWEFPKSEIATNKITVRQLLNHTSGLPLGTIGVRYAPTEQMPKLKESLTQNVLLNCDPGLRFEYSNVGYHLLELLIEEITGRSFSEYMEQEVLFPLGMSHSSFEWQNSFSKNIPFGYDFNGNPIPPYVYPEKASGGLFATVEDVAKFVCAGMIDSKIMNKVISRESILQLYTPSVNKLGFYGFAFDSYGFGHLLEELPDGELAVAHGGQGTGWMTHFHSVPETGDGIVILTNSQRSWPFFAQVLTIWAQWNSFDRVGMSIIYTGEKILWVIVVLLVLLIFWLVLKVGFGIRSSTRSFLPFSKRNRKSRIALIMLFALLSLIYVWAVKQDYIFFTSIFPRITSWLVFIVPALALLMLLIVLFPENDNSATIQSSKLPKSPEPGL